MPVPEVELPAALGYSVPRRAIAVVNPAFDYDALVRPLEPRLMRTVWRVVRRREAAEDALQDALATIWKKRETVARHPRPEALMLRIAVSAAVDALRRERRRLRHEAPGLPDDRAGDGAPPVTKDIEDRDLRAAVLEAIGRLPRRQAAAVVLRLVEERSYEETALAMGCSETTVRVHVLRGRAALARRLARERPDIAAGRERPGEEKAS